MVAVVDLLFERVGTTTAVGGSTSIELLAVAARFACSSTAARVSTMRGGCGGWCFFRVDTAWTSWADEGFTVAVPAASSVATGDSMPAGGVGASTWIAIIIVAGVEGVGDASATRGVVKRAMEVAIVVVAAVKSSRATRLFRVGTAMAPERATPKVDDAAGPAGGASKCAGRGRPGVSRARVVVVVVATSIVTTPGGEAAFARSTSIGVGATIS